MYLMSPHFSPPLQPSFGSSLHLRLHDSSSFISLSASILALFPSCSHNSRSYLPFIYLDVLCSLWGLSSLTRIKHQPLAVKAQRVLTIGPPRNSKIIFQKQIQLNTFNYTQMQLNHSPLTLKSFGKFPMRFKIKPKVWPWSVAGMTCALPAH